MLCLPKAILFGKAYMDGNTQELSFIQNERNANAFRVKAIDFLRKANVTYSPNEGCAIAAIYKLQKVIPEFSICVYESKTNPNKYATRAGNSHRVMNLFYLCDLKHFIYLKSRQQFFGKRECVHNVKFCMHEVRYTCVKKCVVYVEGQQIVLHV